MAFRKWTPVTITKITSGLSRVRPGASQHIGDAA